MPRHLLDGSSVVHMRRFEHELRVKERFLVPAQAMCLEVDGRRRPVGAVLLRLVNLGLLVVARKGQALLTTMSICASCQSLAFQRYLKVRHKARLTSPTLRGYDTANPKRSRRSSPRSDLTAGSHCNHAGRWGTSVAVGGASMAAFPADHPTPSRAAGE